MSRYDDPAEERRTPFDEQLAALLARTADASQPSADLAQRVRQALTANAAPEARSAWRLRFGLPSLGGLAGPALVAALLAVFVLVFAAHGWGGFQPGGATATPTPQTCDDPAMPNNPTPITHPPDHSVALGQSATTHRVTITLLRGYADAVSTIVSYASSLGADVSVHASHATLTDATGASYPELDQTQTSPVGVLIFPPLPQSQLGAPQRLTLSITNLDISVPSSASGTETQTQGTWIIPLTLTPVAGQAIPVTAPAQTHDGVTVTLEELDVAPVGGGLGGVAGGVRARFKISGLDPTTDLNTALNYPIGFISANGSSTGMVRGGPSCGDKLTLTLANGQQLFPGFTTLAGANAPEATVVSVYAHSPIPVGASGTIEAQALFYYTPTARENVTFGINTVSIYEVRNFASVFVRNAQGPWSFSVTLK